MNILMMTNTYLPHVGGVANSVAAFTTELQKRGHRVVVVAPVYKKAENDGSHIIRIPAIQHFNGSDFSVVLPIPRILENQLMNFKPDIVHSHHPFLIGSTAVRISTKYHTPLVYTQHTRFENYTHYVPVGFPRMKKFVINLSTGYAKISDRVIAPSQSIAGLLRKREIDTPIDIVPTGIYTAKFKRGNKAKVRASCNIPEDAFVVGHVGRLAPEKNPEFLADAVAQFLRKRPDAHFMIAGYGPSKRNIDEVFKNARLKHRLHFLGKLKDRDLVDAYHAMDVFAFASRTETQGMVLSEAMAAGVPVVALDAPGVREVVRDGINGYLLFGQDKKLFANTLNRFYKLSPQTRKKIQMNSKKTAEAFSMDNCVAKLLSVYEMLMKENISEHVKDKSVWEKSVKQLKTEWDLWSNLTSAFGNAIQKDKKQDEAEPPQK